MHSKRLTTSLDQRSDFVVVAELAAGPGFNFSPVEKFLKAYQEMDPSSMPQGFDFVGVTAPQNPGGVANLEPADVLARVKTAGLLGDLDFIPHISCKDENVAAITSSLVGFRAQGIESVLALTGDKPVGSKRVFEVESVGLLQLIRKMNYAAYLKAAPGQWDRIDQFFPGAAVSPFKYTEASQMQQYFKMEKKIASGARFLITQVGWDWRKSLELMRYLKENDLDIPVLGNVYLLTTKTAAPRLMHDGKLPGCFVSNEFYGKLQSENVDQHIERAAQQVAMYKSIGAAGVDLGGLLDFDTFVKILNLAAEIGDAWEEAKENLCWPGGSRYYLYDEAGNRTAPVRHKIPFRCRSFNVMHRLALDPDHLGFKACRAVMGAAGARKGTGLAYRSFAAMEKVAKYALFSCEDCGDCYLPENFGFCTMGGCEKGLSNAPCGDSTADGHCGNNLDRICTGERIFEAAAASPGGTERLRRTIGRPRNPELQHSSSVLNYLFGKDHTGRGPLISIGDLIHASHPKTGKVMREILELGDEAFSQETGPVKYIRALIQSQVDEGADYVAVNVDALCGPDERVAVKLMRQYVEIVRRSSGGIPVCIDSAFPKALTAGLEKWYEGGNAASSPLVGPVRVNGAEEILSLKPQYDFGFVAQIDGASSGEVAVEEALDQARQLFEKAVGRFGFSPEQIFFDSVAMPLVKDEPTLPSGCGRTHTAFEMIRRIKHDSLLKRSHCVLRIADMAAELPGRAIGVCRAYVAAALECGLDAAFVDVERHFGESPADSRLLELVDACARMDGAPERTRHAKELMAKFCAEVSKPRRPASAPALSKP